MIAQGDALGYHGIPLWGDLDSDLNCYLIWHQWSAHIVENWGQLSG